MAQNRYNLGMDKRKYDRPRTSKAGLRRLERLHIINSLLREGKSQAEIGNIFGISRQAINQIINRHKHLARKKLNYDVEKGFIKKPNECDSCKANTSLEGHHDDYGLYDKVYWLCKGCHMIKHTKFNK